MSRSANLDINFKKEAIKETLVNFIVPLIALSVSIAVGFFILYPSYKALPDLRSTLETKTTLEKNLSKKLDNLNDLVRFKKSVDENSDLVNTVLVSEKLVPALLTQVDKIVRASGMKINKLSYTTGSSSTDEGSDYNTVAVNLNTEGTFLQLLGLLRSFESTARMVNVENVRYSTKIDEEEGEKVSASFSLESPYLFVESTAVTDAPINLDISSPEFIALLNRIKKFKYFDPYEVDDSVEVIEETVEDAEAGAEGGVGGSGGATDVGIFGSTGENTTDEVGDTVGEDIVE